MKTRHWTSLAYVGLLLTGLAFTAACGDDSGVSDTPSGSIALATGSTFETGERGGPAVELVFTATQGANFLSAGEVIDVAELPVLSGAAPIGHFTDAAASPTNTGQVEQTILSENGSVTVRFFCDAEGSTVIFAATRKDPTASAQVAVDCTPGPDGTFGLDMKVTGGALRPGGQSVTITANLIDFETEEARDEEGVAVRFAIDEGESLTFAGGARSVTETTDGDGEVSFEMVTGSTEGPTTVTAEFVDSRYDNGRGASEVFTVRENSQDGTELQITIKRNSTTLINQEDWRVLADGADRLSIEAQIVPIPDATFSVAAQPVVFSMAAGGKGYLRANDADTVQHQELTIPTDTDGISSVLFQGGADGGGAATITISVPDPDPTVDRTLEVPLTISITSLGFIEFESASPEVLYVLGSGENQSTDVKFRVLDTQRRPLQGIRVDFSLNNPPQGVALDVPAGTSNIDGEVVTVINSGRGTGTVSVTATGSFGDAAPIVADSPSIPIIGARPSRKGWSVRCEYRNIGGLIGRQGNTIDVDEQFECTSILTDRFTNPIGIPQGVLFKSEGGNILSLATSEAWDTSRNPDAPPDDVGRLETLYSPAGDPPCDVAEFDDEPWVEVGGDCSVPFNGCPDRGDDTCIRNPRDGLVTILAFTSGEEEFSDINGNGLYDPGEPFRDIGEPFIDANDNNMYDPGEVFEDLESGTTGQYDPPNGQWDGNTTIWTTARVLLTGSAASGDAVDGEPFAGFGFFFDGNGDFNAPLVNGCVQGFGTWRVGFWWLDENLNGLNNSASYSAELTGNSTGLRIDRVLGSEGDSFGFAVANDFEFIDRDAGISTYVTNVGGFEGGYPGVPQVYEIACTRDDINDCSLAPNLAVEATYRVSDGVGGNAERVYTIPLNLSLQPCPGN